jgi:hypothetical protein
VGAHANRATIAIASACIYNAHVEGEEEGLVLDDTALGFIEQSLFALHHAVFLSLPLTYGLVPGEANCDVSIRGLSNVFNSIGVAFSLLGREDESLYR